jgi:hypothetical protein
MATGHSAAAQVTGEDVRTVATAAAVVSAARPAGQAVPAATAAVVVAGAARDTGVAREPTAGQAADRAGQVAVVAATPAVTLITRDGAVPVRVAARGATSAALADRTTAVMAAAGPSAALTGSQARPDAVHLVGRRHLLSVAAAVADR